MEECAQMSLRTKLIIASCGPLLILIVVGLVSIRTITQSSRAVERIFRENYDSVAAGQRMKDALEQMDRSAEAFVWQNDGDRQKIDSAIDNFSRSLEFQGGNVTVPGEQELTDRLIKLWGDYKSELESFLKMPETGSARRDVYRNRLLPLSDQVLDAAQQVIAINLNNMVSTDGQVRQRAVETNRTLVILVISGVLLAIILIAIIGSSIVRPISHLARSVKEIQQGNLDLLVKARSGDEIGQLATAFNEMTSSLREFRRSNRAHLIRIQNATLSALNSLSDAIVICNPYGEIELANHTAENLFGLKAGAPIQSVENEKLRELFERVRSEERTISFKTYDSAIQVFKDGEERFFLPEAVPILDESRRFVGATLIFSDVTRIRQVDEVKSSLISTVSHELKTPLTSIRLATHVLLNEKLGLLNPKQMELVAAAREDSERLFRIIENLLEIGRMETGRTKLELAPVNTEQILLNVMEDMRPSFADRGVEFDLDLPGDIPNVLADRFRLEIVFTNLLNNALKHTPPGGKVRVSAREEDDNVVFSVEDSGRGIPREYLPHIFEKFFRVPGQAQQGDFGLGLSIVKEIVEAHGSRIEVASSPGKGTRFVFSLKPGVCALTDMQVGNR
jgi:two-component system, NtrC family, sensor histidine kinase KinB